MLLWGTPTPSTGPGEVEQALQQGLAFQPVPQQQGVGAESKALAVLGPLGVGSLSIIAHMAPGPGNQGPSGGFSGWEEALGNP